MKIETELKRLVKYSKQYHKNGWMPATAGNLSIFDRTQNQVSITASGKNKSKLTEKDFILMDPDTKEILKDTKDFPSAETSIHLAIYKNIPTATAIVHVHLPETCKIKFNMEKYDFAKRFYLPNIEILKAFGNFNENPNLASIVTYNHGDVEQIATDISDALFQYPSDVPFFITENHGITVWGNSVEEANKHLEAADFILRTMI